MPSSFEIQFNRVFKLLFVWLFGDVIFAVLPIATIAFIDVLLGSGFKDFLLLKEWSFATIVFFGICIRKLIRLKIKIQHVPTSYKLDTGVQLYVVLLIASVLVLSLVILGEKGVLRPSQTDLLGTSQLALFLIGLFSIFSAVQAEEKFDLEAMVPPKRISRYWFFRRLISRVEQATNCLDYVISATKQVSSIEFSEFDSQISQQVKEERLHGTLQNAIENLEKTVTQSKTQLESLKASTARSVSVKL